jgi:hypothetical protein
MRHLLLLVLGTALACPALAQITITEADLRTYATRAYTVANYDAQDPTRFQALTQRRGGPFTFDFTGTSYTTQPATRFTPVTCSAALPGCDDPRLSAAGIIQRAESPDLPGVAVQFTDLDATGYRLRGGASRGDFDPTTPGEESFKYVTTPASLALPLPLTMGRTWSSTYRYEITYNGAIQPAENVTDQGEVLAYGTLVTPAGSADALMVRERSIVTSTAGGQTTTDTTFTYSFITKGALQASLFADAKGVVLSADYTVLGPTTGVSPRAAADPGVVLVPPRPNPAGASTRIAFTLDAAHTARVSVHDLLGREVAVVAEGAFAAGPHEVLLDASRLAPGAYLVRLTAGGTVRSHVLSVAR